MRKIVLIMIILIITVVTSIFAITIGSSSFSIYRYYKKTPGGWNWWEETNPIIANATATGSWNTGGYIILPATPNYYHAPQITWNVEISQWIYLSIQYFNYTMHVDAPGDYSIDSLSFEVMSNGGVFVHLNTGGYLTDGANNIPTWFGYNVDSSTAPATGLPSNGSNDSFWHDMVWINNNVGNPAQQFTLYPGGWWEHTFYGWLGFRVSYKTAKGDYMTWLDIYIQSDP